MAVETASVKYVFFDVVGFTKDRSVEAQSDIVMTMNRIVKETISDYSIPDEQMIVLTGGDSLCLAILELSKIFDIHLSMALGILDRLHAHNSEEKDEKRRFQVRIGLNENVDNLITDFNGNRSVAGAGVNMAQRIMDKADGGQVLVSETVYETLRHREQFMNAFRQYKAQSKHGITFNVYQYINPGHNGLNIKMPSIFAPRQFAEQGLPKLVAYYMAQAIKNRDVFFKKVNEPAYEYSSVVLLFFLACDSEEASKAAPYNMPSTKTWGAGEATIDDQFRYYKSHNFWVMVELHNEICDNYLKQFNDCFEASSRGRNYVFISDKGQAKLKKDWPDIWKQFSGE